MEYKRLTDKDVTKVCFDPWELCGLYDLCTRDCRKPEPCKIPQIIHRLAELEDKIEAGTLVELPYKIGDVAYTCSDSSIYEWEIKEIDILGWDTLFRLGKDDTDDYSTRYLSEVGDYLFFDKAEAEKKLEEFENETI